jgi:hypothetical protein
MKGMHRIHRMGSGTGALDEKHAQSTLASASRVEACHGRFPVLTGDGAILVGHSAGATSLLMTLATLKPPRRIAGLFLIAAPYCGAEDWQIKGLELPRKLERKVPAKMPIFLYHGREDETVPFAHIDLFARALPRALVRRLDGRNHQLNDDLSEVAIDIWRLYGS